MWYFKFSLNGRVIVILKSIDNGFVSGKSIGRFIKNRYKVKKKKVNFW